ncbi:MAG TPA: GAF domain-containing protein [Ktedonobacteraceae bacterium]|nr:GAF domain-containing protein [Ktedonobacteraceae bacterium]
MEDPQTWQELLRNVASDPLEHQRIAREMGVNQITLTRWMNRTSTPRPASLRPLLDAIPQHRQKMLQLLQKDFPKFSLESPQEEEVVAEIPAAFYANIMNIYTTSPPILRSSAICVTIFQQMLRHLDPLKLGLQVVICLCMAPGEGERVHSLYMTQGRATRPWESVIDNDIAFLGLESQAGNVVSRGHPIITQSHKERAQRYPVHTIPYAESVATYPLLYFDRIAGAVSVISTQQNHFTAAHTELMQSYTELLILAFEPEQFYPLKEIDLGIVPSREIQEPYLEKFQLEVTAVMLEAEKSGQRLKRAEAELRVWKKLEKIFLQGSNLS